MTCLEGAWGKTAFRLQEGPGVHGKDSDKGHLKGHLKGHVKGHFKGHAKERLKGHAKGRLKGSGDIPA